MTITRFKKIATATSSAFWPAAYQHLTPEEVTYLRKTPAARRNLDRRLISALAKTLLTPDQINDLKDIDLEPDQTYLGDTQP